MEQKKKQYKNINQTSQGGKYRCEFVCEAWISFGLIEGGGEWRAITAAVSAVEPTNLPWSQSLFPRQAARLFIVSISVVHIQTNRVFYRLCWKKNKQKKHPVTKHGGRPSSVVNCLLPTVPGTLTPGTLGPDVQTVQGLDFSEAAQKLFVISLKPVWSSIWVLISGHVRKIVLGTFLNCTFVLVLFFAVGWNSFLGKIFLS